MEEIWKLFKDSYTYKTGKGAIREVEPIYVSNMGNIRGRKLHDNGRGYLIFHYKCKDYKLHRVVAELFIPNPENKPCIDHINTVKTDNRVCNLRWCSHKENNNNPLTLEKYKQINPKKAKIAAKKLSKPVKCIESGEIFNSTREAEEHYNLKRYSISKAANPKQNNKTAGIIADGTKLHWKYI